MHEKYPGIRYVSRILPAFFSLSGVYWNSLLTSTRCVFCERFELRSHFISRLRMIVWVNVVLIRTIVVESD